MSIHSFLWRCFDDQLSYITVQFLIDVILTKIINFNGYKTRYMETFLRQHEDTYLQSSKNYIVTV